VFLIGTTVDTAVDISVNTAVGTAIGIAVEGACHCLVFVSSCTATGKVDAHCVKKKTIQRRASDHMNTGSACNSDALYIVRRTTCLWCTHSNNGSECLGYYITVQYLPSMTLLSIVLRGQIGSFSEGLNRSTTTRTVSMTARTDSTAKSR
jgi:hypothetical protein